MTENIAVSVVLPIYNEEENLPLIYKELHDVFEDQSYNYEILFVNDGSSDKSGSVLKEIQAQDSHVVVINLRKNFGQTAGLTAGFDYAKGEVIVTMDGDLQNDPADIPQLLTKIEEGYDVVAGWRKKRKDPFINRRLPSMIANKIISFTTGVKLHDYGCTLKAFKREVVEHIELYGEMHRFIPAIASGFGVSLAEIPVNHRPRRFGTSKYGITRTFRVILDLITVKFLLSYSKRPIHIFGMIGLGSFSLGLLLAMVMIFQRQFYGIALADRPLFLMAILFILVGVQFITIGLISELQVRTYHESQKKPIYYIKDMYSGE